MSPTRSVGPVASAAARGILSRESMIVGAALLAATALAWAWLLRSSASANMDGMSMLVRPFSAGYLLAAFLMWAIMMVAMMVPSATPMILLHARVDRRLSAAARIGHALVFTSSYLLVWSAFALLAAMVQAGAVALGIVASVALVIRIPALEAALLLGAAAYELMPAKRQCLNKCQAPLLFLYRHYRPGIAGAFRTGLVHGLYCLGCCWVLMLLLFAGGVMNLAWVAILGLAIIGEKQAPPQWHANRWIAGLLAAAALAILIGR